MALNTTTVVRAAFSFVLLTHSSFNQSCFDRKNLPFGLGPAYLLCRGGRTPAHEAGAGNGGPPVNQADVFNNWMETVFRGIRDQLLHSVALMQVSHDGTQVLSELVITFQHNYKYPFVPPTLALTRRDHQEPVPPPADDAVSRNVRESSSLRCSSASAGGTRGLSVTLSSVNDDDDDDDDDVGGGGEDEEENEDGAAAGHHRDAAAIRDSQNSSNDGGEPGLTERELLAVTRAAFKRLMKELASVIRCLPKPDQNSRIRLRLEYGGRREAANLAGGMPAVRGRAHGFFHLRADHDDFSLVQSASQLVRFGFESNIDIGGGGVERAGSQLTFEYRGPEPLPSSMFEDDDEEQQEEEEDNTPPVAGEGRQRPRGPRDFLVICTNKENESRRLPSNELRWLVGVVVWLLRSSATERILRPSDARNKNNNSVRRNSGAASAAEHIVLRPTAVTPRFLRVQMMRLFSYDDGFFDSDTSAVAARIHDWLVRADIIDRNTNFVNDQLENRRLAQRLAYSRAEGMFPAVAFDRADFPGDVVLPAALSTAALDKQLLGMVSAARARKATSAASSVSAAAAPVSAASRAGDRRQRDMQ